MGLLRLIASRVSRSTPACDTCVANGGLSLLCNLSTAARASAEGGRLYPEGTRPYVGREAAAAAGRRSVPAISSGGRPAPAAARRPTRRPTPPGRVRLSRPGPAGVTHLPVRPNPAP